VGVRDSTGSRADAKVDEYYGVNQNGAEKAEEDPEVVKPKTLILVGDINPAL
jgi:hypothetical protein